GDREYMLALWPAELRGDTPFAFEDGCIFFNLEVRAVATALAFIGEMSRKQIREDLKPIGVAFQERNNGVFANGEFGRVGKHMQQVARCFPLGKSALTSFSSIHLRKNLDQPI